MTASVNSVHGQMPKQICGAALQMPLTATPSVHIYKTFQTAHIALFWVMSELSTKSYKSEQNTGNWHVPPSREIERRGAS